MALAVMLVLTILVTSTLAFTSSNSRDASAEAVRTVRIRARRGRAQRRACAALLALLLDSSGAPTNNTTLYSASWFTSAGILSSQQSPSSTAACTSTSTCMSWSAASWTPGGGAVHRTGECSSSNGVGRVPNPTGGTALDADRDARRSTMRAAAVARLHSQLLVGALLGRDQDIRATSSSDRRVNANVADLRRGQPLRDLRRRRSRARRVTLKVLGNIRLQNGGRRHRQDDAP